MIVLLLILIACPQVKSQFQLTMGQILLTEIAPGYVMPIVNSVRLSEQYLYPTSMRSEQKCFGNSLTEVKSGQQLIVIASQPFTLFFTTQFTDNYLNMQQYYRQNLENITINALMLSTQNSPDSQNMAKLPLSMKCNYDMHPYFRLKGSLNVQFYLDNQQEKFEFNLLLVCAEPQDIASFSDFYVPGYIIFWMLFNLVIQVYHNYPRYGQHFACFIVFLGASLAIKNDLLAYLLGGGGMLLLIFRQRKNHAINSKMFTLYMFFGVVVSLQALLTFQGGKQHQIWNSFWIALDNFIGIHIAMLMVLRLLKLSRIRHVFWYFVAVSLFSLLYDGNNRFFQLQFKNPLDLTCIKISVFFPVMMLPISNYFCTITSWMPRVICIGILVASVAPISLAIPFMGIFLMGVLLFQVYHKDLGVIRHRC